MAPEEPNRQTYLNKRRQPKRWQSSRKAATPILNQTPLKVHHHQKKPHAANQNKPTNASKLIIINLRAGRLQKLPLKPTKPRTLGSTDQQTPSTAGFIQLLEDETAGITGIN